MFKRILLIVGIVWVGLLAAGFIMLPILRAVSPVPLTLEDVYKTAATCSPHALQAAENVMQQEGKVGGGDDGPYVRSELWVAKIDYQCGKEQVAANNWPTAREYFEKGINLEHAAMLMSSWDDPILGCRFARDMLSSYITTGAIARKMNDPQFYQFAQDKYQGTAAWIAGECS